MTSSVVATGLIAAVVFGFGAHSQAMFRAGGQRMLRPVIDAFTANLVGWLLMFAVALAALYFFPAWASSVAIFVSAIFLALAGAARYLAPPGAFARDLPAATRSSAFLPVPRAGEAWAMAFFLAGSALTGSVTLAVAFAGLTVLTVLGLCLWAAAGWSGCQMLSSGWHRRHLDWAFGIFLFVAGIAALLPG